MTEKNIFVYKLSLPLNISYFSLFFVKTATPPPPEKSYPLFSSNLPLKVEVLSSPPSFWKFGRRFNPPSRKGGRGAHYEVGLTRSVSQQSKYPFLWLDNVKENFQYLKNKWINLILQSPTCLWRKRLWISQKGIFIIFLESVGWS